MKITMRIFYISWFVLGAALVQAQEVLDYKSMVAAPQAIYYAIAAETDSLLNTLPPDTSWESQGLYILQLEEKLHGVEQRLKVLEASQR